MLLGSSSFIFMSPMFTMGVILGGLIIIANFNLLQYTIQCAFSPGMSLKSNKMSIIAKYYFRLAIIGIIIYILITNGWVEPIGLTLGLSIVVISIVNLGIRIIWRTSSGETI